MATQIKISELPLANESALSLAADDRLIFNNDNVNTQTIKFANFVDAILEQNLTFTGNCSFTQPITGPNGGDIQVGLDDLVDVQFQNVQSGQLIQYSGTQWINIDVADVTVQLSSLSVKTADTPMGGGKLEYDNTNGEFTFTPAVQNTFAKTDLSVTTPIAASGQGSLTYDSANGTFTFTKPDSYTKGETYSQAEVDATVNGKADVGDSYLKAETYSTAQVDAAIGGKIAYTDLSVTQNAASGGGTLTYNDAGQFSYTPADLSAFETGGGTDSKIAAVTGANLDLSGVDTGDLSEGTNLYYTDARADARVSAGITANNASYISIADLKTLVAAAGDYSAFQTAIAAL